MSGVLHADAPRGPAKTGRDRRNTLDRAAARTLHAIDPSGPSLRAYMRLAHAAIAHEDEDEACADAELAERARSCAVAFRRGQASDRELIEAMRLARECARRAHAMRHHPVQLAAGAALACGVFVELSTGEGKTLAATIPAIIAGWRGRGCHVLTANDYLVERDAAFVRPMLARVALGVGAVTASASVESRRRAYQADVTYLTPKSACADHLRDRLASTAARSDAGRIAHALAGATPADIVQRGLACAIVDEADALLIDEAVTPLVLSQRDNAAAPAEELAQGVAIARRLRETRDYRLRRAHQEVALTSEGRARVAEHAEPLGGLWTGASRREDIVTTALRAMLFFERDRDYIVRDARVVIVDPFTGRVMPDRSWSRGLHQAVEAKEGLDHATPTRTSASLSFQRFFQRYERLSGMSGTLREAAPELRLVYRARTLAMPTHRPTIRTREADAIYATSDARWRSVVRRVRAEHDIGRPVLVGTRSVASSERLSAALHAEGIAHELLNARHDEHEASVIAGAGRAGAVTIATNMAGRGTDITLDERAREAGGLHVIVAEMNDGARIDRQLLGRAGRQGDPGSGVVLASLEDELIARSALKSLVRAGGALARSDGRIPRPIATIIAKHTQRCAQARARGQRTRLRSADERFDDAIAFAGEAL